jgi:hypothetical protein
VKIGVNRWLNLCGAVAAGGSVVVFCFILLGHDPLIFWNDDYELSILPVFADVARSWNEGHLPLLSPYSWVCSNLAGEFQYGTFSIFINAAVVLIWKFPLTFPQQAAALSMAHLFVLAMGAFLLGRERGLSHALAMLVAVVTTLSGWIICWGATDWFGALGAFAWLPWCWWGLERSLASGLKMEGGAPATPASPGFGPPRASRWLCAMIWPAPFVYLLVTGGFPYTVVMLGLLVGWMCLRQICRTRSLTSIIPTLVGVMLGFGLSAPAWLALLDYVHGSNRSAQSAIAHWQWLVPPAALPGFILPAWTVNWADFSTRYVPHRAAELACGLVPPAALLWGLFFRGREFVRKIRWELGLLAVVCALSMLPSAGVFRWSFRWLPFLHLIMVLCAAEALRIGSDRVGVRSAFLRGPPVFALALVALTTGASFLFGANGPYAGPVAICTILMVFAWIGADFSVATLREWAPAAVAFGVLLSTYLVIPPNCGVPKYNLSQELLNPAPLDPARLYLSVYPPAEVIYRMESKPRPIGQITRPGSTSMWAGLRFINGYSPILPSGVGREWGFAIHGEFDWAMQKKLLETQDGSELLDYLGVDGIVVAAESGLRPLPVDKWQEVFASDEGKVYHRSESPSPRVAFLEPAVVVTSDAPAETHFTLIEGLVEEEIDSRTSMKFWVPGATEKTVLLSRPYFPGYRASINGQEVPVGSWRGLIPAIKMPVGFEGPVEVSYRPWWLVWGGAISICCLLVVMVVGILIGRRGLIGDRTA